jgi:hypothetical protein
MGTLRIAVLGIVFVVWLGPLLFVPLPIVLALIASAAFSIWRGAASSARASGLG